MHNQNRDPEKTFIPDEQVAADVHFPCTHFRISNRSLEFESRYPGSQVTVI